MKFHLKFFVELSILYNHDQDKTGVGDSVIKKNRQYFSVLKF